MMRFILSSRSNFFTAHIVLSILLACLSLVWIFFIWYPPPLAKAVGVTHIFLMMLAIDVVLGPLLGLIVYKQGKKSLKFDLGVIIAIQLMALSYGIYSIAQGRPVWIAYEIDRFELVKNNEVFYDLKQEVQPMYQHPSWFKPQFVAVEFAKDKNQRNNDMFAEVLGGISLAQRPERYAPLSHAIPQLQQHSQSLDLLQKYNSKLAVDNVLKKYPQATAWIPLKANSQDMVVLIERQNGQVVAIVDLRPWQ